MFLCLNQDQSFSTGHEPGPGAYSLSNIYRPLFININKSNGEQSKSRDITSSGSQFDYGSRWAPISENSLDMIERILRLKCFNVS